MPAIRPWYAEGPQMLMPEHFLEHLLACLANQKYINEVNADGLSMGRKKVRKVQRRTQEAIDDAYHYGWELLKAASDERVQADAELRGGA